MKRDIISTLKKIPLLLCTFAVLSAPGCAVFHVYQTGGPEGREAGNQPATEWQSKNLNSFGWNLRTQDYVAEKCTLSNGTRLGIEELKVETNAGNTLASVATLGFWTRLKVSYRCAKPKPITGTLAPSNSTTPAPTNQPAVEAN